MIVMVYRERLIKKGTCPWSWPTQDVHIWHTDCLRDVDNNMLFK